MCVCVYVCVCVRVCVCVCARVCVCVPRTHEQFFTYLKNAKVAVEILDIQLSAIFHCTVP